MGSNPQDLSKPPTHTTEIKHMLNPELEETTTTSNNYFSNSNHILQAPKKSPRVWMKKVTFTWPLTAKKFLMLLNLAGVNSMKR